MNPVASTRTLRWSIPCIGAALVFLRIWYVYHLRVDRDEGQHLHTIWAIGNGQMMYGDVFDNHMPLFHLLCAPLMLWLGERSDIVMIMRLAVIPAFVAALVLVYAISRSLYKDEATSWWALLFTGLFPVFLFTGTEFRPDQCWTVLWLAALLVLITGKLNVSRCFWSGILLGLAVAVSMKTVLMLLSIAGAALITLFIVGHKPDFRAALRIIGALNAGLFIAPACVVAWFAAHGKLASFWYCVIEHNIRYAHDDSSLRHARFAVFPIGLALVLWGARAIFRSSATLESGMRQVFIFATGGIYFAMLFAFWVVLNNETCLPGIAVLTPALAAALSFGSRRIYLPVLFSLVEVIVVLIARPLRWQMPTSEHELLDEILAITRPGDFVMDETGETIFRKRPFFLLLETLTRDALKRGAISDTIAHDIVASRCSVAVRGSRYPAATLGFLHENFQPLGQLLVAGRVVRCRADTSCRTRFDIAVPATYALITRRGDFSGILDGTRYTGPRLLAVGPHEIIPDKNTKSFVAVWARAIDHGFKYRLD